MLPVFLDIRFDTPTSQKLLYLIGVLLIAYGAWSGWRSAQGAMDAKSHTSGPATTRDRTSRAVRYAVIFAVLVRLGFYYALPAGQFLGKRGMGFPLHAYGLLLMTGFLCAAAVCGLLAEREWPGEEGKRKRVARRSGKAID